MAGPPTAIEPKRHCPFAATRFGRATGDRTTSVVLPHDWSRTGAYQNHSIARQSANRGNAPGHAR